MVASSIGCLRIACCDGCALPHATYSVSYLHPLPFWSSQSSIVSNQPKVATAVFADNLTAVFADELIRMALPWLLPVCWVPLLQAVKLVFEGTKEVLVPVKETSKEDNITYMSSLYERCQETRAKTMQTLQEKWLQPLIKPKQAAK